MSLPDFEGAAHRLDEIFSLLVPDGEDEILAPEFALIEGDPRRDRETAQVPAEVDDAEGVEGAGDAHLAAEVLGEIAQTENLDIHADVIAGETRRGQRGRADSA